MMLSDNLMSLGMIYESYMYNVNYMCNICDAYVMNPWCCYMPWSMSCCHVVVIYMINAACVGPRCLWCCDVSRCLTYLSCKRLSLMHTHSEMRAYALEFLLTSDENSCPGAFAHQRRGLMPWEYIYAPSDEGLCHGLVPHAFKMLELHSQVKLHCRVKLFNVTL